MKKIFLIIGYCTFMLIFNLSSNFCIASQTPPPPLNDDCANATPIIPGSSCSFVQYTNIASTASAETAPSCAGSVFNDIWFSVIVPSSGHLIFDSQAGSTADIGMAIYSGSCGSLTAIECDDDDGSGNMSMIDKSGLIAGSIIYIRVWDYGGTNSGAFSICVYEPAPPVNDNCAGAISLTLGSTCVPVEFNTFGASVSPEVNPGCTSSVTSDMWFSAVVPASGRICVEAIVGTIYDGAMALYSGTCGALTLLSCDDNSGVGDMPKIDKVGLLPGSTVYIRFWANGTATAGTFSLCVTSPPFIPNDDCPNAIPLTVGATCNYAQYSNFGATVSAAPLSPCDLWGTPPADVWFSAVVPASGRLLINSDIAGGFWNGMMDLYSGSCNALTLIDCDDYDSPNGDMPLIHQVDLTPGSTVYIRFWEKESDEFGNFSICATEPAPLVNDNCNGAILLPINTICSYTDYTTAGATPSSEPDPGCGGTVFNDVWFKVVIPGSGDLSLSTASSDAASSETLTDGAMALYKGSCGALTLITCIDNALNADLMPSIDLAGLVAGDTLFIRFWDVGGDNVGMFSICASMPPPPCATNPNAADFCSTPTPICNFNGYCGNTSAAYTIDTPGNLSSLFDGSIENNSWLSFVADGTTTTLNIYVGNCTDGSGIQMQIFGTTDCNTFVSYSPTWTPGSVVNGSITATGLTPGQTYLLMIDGYGGDVCDYTMSVDSGVLMTVVTSESDSICAGQSTQIEAIGGSSFIWSPASSLSNPNISNPIASPTVTTTYTVSVTGGNTACPNQGVATTVVYVNSSMNYHVSISDTSICIGDSISLILTGDTSYNYLWSSNPPGLTGSSFNNILFPTQDISYILNVDDEGACSSKDTLKVSVNAYPVVVINPPQDVICIGDSIKLNSSGGTIYTWSSNPNSFNSSLQSPFVKPAVSTTYLLSVDNGIGCVSTSSAIVNVDKKPVLILSPSNNITMCRGVDTLLIVSGGVSYLWSNGLTDSAINVNPINSSMYNVVARNGECHSDTVFNVEVIQYPVVDLGSDIKVCKGTPVVIDANTNSNQVVWSNGEIGQAISVADSGEYSVIVSNICGNAKDTVRVDFNPRPIINIGNDSTLCVNNLPLVLPNNYAKYFWSTGDLSNTIIAEVGGTYSVEVVDFNGCKAMDTIVLTDSCFTDVYIPNTFTPEGNGINEVFKVISVSIIDFEMYIFNRWGEKMFYSNDIEMGWDGTWSGSPCKEDVYCYQIKYRGLRDGLKMKTGFVNLIR
ncbi:MAG: gliding motility-associated C-terminal domain-containing protein [Bacteroidota bacterium]